MKIEEQLIEWANGNSIHNEERGECCPDFSCCVPEAKADKDVRQRFLKAYMENDQRLMGEMLGNFLANIIQHKTGQIPYVAGLGVDKGRIH
ncbi:MAG: hypothetical protein QNJ81_06845 [Acidimicrobiia bacterium]|nr:hypothetical protein [Acidimicrobiia bacterium]